MTSFSLVIPCYNEEKNLPHLVARCAQVIQRGDVEVIFVNNGSRDRTAAILPKLIAPHAFAKLVQVDVNQGYGFGILSGLRAAQGDILGWTHADMQTDPGDAIRGLELFLSGPAPERIFVKGKRYERPPHDLVFSWGMALFESAVLGERLWDINAQPTMFHRRFYESWISPPHDFSLDLYAYYRAVRAGLTIRRIPVRFGRRYSGIGHNDFLAAKLRLSLRTIGYSMKLRQRARSEKG